MYKAEFFAQDFAFAAAYLLDEADTVLTLDYLTMDKCSLDLPVRKTPVKKGDFCRVSRVGGTVLADFTVADCSCEESDCTVSLRPLQAVLDVDVYNDGIPDCAAWLAQQIRTYLIANSDAAQNRALVLENTVPAADRPLTLDGDTANLLDVLATALTAYRLVLDAQLDLGCAGSRPAQRAGAGDHPGGQLRQQKQVHPAPHQHRPGDWHGDGA